MALGLVRRRMVQAEVLENCMRYHTQFGTYELTDEELQKIENLTHQVGLEAIEELAFMLIQEEIWPDPGTLGLYLRRMKK